MSSTVQGTELREETLVWLTGTGSLGAHSQNVPVVVTGMGWKQGSMSLATHGAVGGVKKAEPEAKGSHERAEWPDGIP